jgi:hypothetical protein
MTKPKKKPAPHKKKEDHIKELLRKAYEEMQEARKKA